jgi:hypothetical protein
MSVPAWVIAIVRSLVQAGVSVLASQAWFNNLTGWLAENAGITLTTFQIETFAFGIAFTLVVGATNYLGKLEQFQWLNQVISLFLSNSAAVYDKSEVAGGTGVADTEVDMGGEETYRDESGEAGAASVSLILVIVAIVLAVLTIFGVGGSVPLLALAIICLGVAHLV